MIVENKKIHSGSKFSYHIGQKIGDRTILSDKIIKESVNKNTGLKRNVFYVKTVCKCGFNQIIQLGQLVNRKACRSCSIEKRGLGYKDVCSDFFTKIRQGALKRSMVFDLTPKDIYDKYIEQDKKCIFSGIELVFTQRRLRKKEQVVVGQKQERGSASVDRIDSSKGYTKDNIQITHKHINLMKRDHSDDYFIELCKKVSDFRTKI